MYVVEVWDRKLDDGSAERRIGRSAVVMVNRAAEILPSSIARRLMLGGVGRSLDCVLELLMIGPARASVANIRKCALRWLRATLLNSPQFARAARTGMPRALRSSLQKLHIFKKHWSSAQTQDLAVPNVAKICKLWLACHFRHSGVNGSQVKQEVQLRDHGLRRFSRPPLYNSCNAFPNQATQSLHIP